MKKSTLLAVSFACVVLAVSGTLPAQESPIKPARFNEPFPAFTLPALQGGDVSLAALKGKNVLIIFPRGRYESTWCQICHYQYADLADLEAKRPFRQRLNLEVLYVLPYDRATVEHWASIFPEQMAVIEGWKNPPVEAQKDPRAARWMEMTRRFFPKKFVFDKKSVPTPFPILIDGERKLSEGLQLFTLFWDGSYAEQNVPTVFLLDKEGVVRFKYLSQSTADRPDAEALLTFVERML